MLFCLFVLLVTSVICGLQDLVEITTKGSGRVAWHCQMGTGIEAFKGQINLN